MQINGYDYHFSYTVGAYCAIADLHLTPAKTMAEQCKIITQMAIIMSKAYEDARKVEDPAYVVRYLRPEEVSALSIADVIEVLAPEVDAAVAAGSYRTVEAKEPKNARGAVRKSN